MSETVPILNGHRGVDASHVPSVAGAAITHWSGRRLDCFECGSDNLASALIDRRQRRRGSWKEAHLAATIATPLASSGNAIPPFQKPHRIEQTATPTPATRSPSLDVTAAFSSTAPMTSEAATRLQAPTKNSVGSWRTGNHQEPLRQFSFGTATDLDELRPPKSALERLPQLGGLRRLSGGSRAWNLSSVNGRPTLSPSVDYDSPGRRCHFWLREGDVIWVRSP